MQDDTTTHNTTMSIDITLRNRYIDDTGYDLFYNNIVCKPIARSMTKRYAMISRDICRWNYAKVGQEGRNCILAVAAPAALELITVHKHRS